MAWTYITWQSTGTQTLPIPVWPILFGLGLFHWLSHRVDANEEFTKLNPTTFALALGTMSAIALAFVPLGYRPFIYFQF